MLRFFFAKIREINENIHGKTKSVEAVGEDSEQAKKKAVGLYDWEKVVDWVSKELNMTWFEVMRMNAYKFNHRVQYLTHVAKEKHSIQMKAMQNAKRVRRT